MSFTFADLFAGIGGFHAALHPLGGKCVFVSEWDEYAAQTYTKNWLRDSTLEVSGDIKKITEENLVNVPSHDVLTGGFPCQPFSKSGNQHGVSEARGTLFYNILKIIEKRQPKLILLENVRNLVGPKHIDDYRIMIRLLRELGYVVSDQPTILSPHEVPERLGGSPQHRERIFIGAVRMSRTIASQMSNIGPLLHRNPFREMDNHEWNLINYLEKKAPRKSKEIENSKINSEQARALKIWNEFLKQHRKFTRETLPGHPLWSEFWKNRNEFTIPRDTPDWKRRFINLNNEFYQVNKTWIDDWMNENDFNSLIPSYRKFEWQAKEIKDIRECLIQFRPSGIRVKNPSYVPTFVAMAQTPVLGWEERTLTIGEAKVLQGFPKNFDFSEQRNSLTFKQIGNAVHVGVANIVFQGLIKRAIGLGQPWAQNLDLESFDLDRIPENQGDFLL